MRRVGKKLTPELKEIAKNSGVLLSVTPFAGLRTLPKVLALSLLVFVSTPIAEAREQYSTEGEMGQCSFFQQLIAAECSVGQTVSQSASIALSVEQFDPLTQPALEGGCPVTVLWRRGDRPRRQKEIFYGGTIEIPSVVAIMKIDGRLVELQGSRNTQISGDKISINQDNYRSDDGRIQVQVSWHQEGARIGEGASDIAGNIEVRRAGETIRFDVEGMFGFC